MWIKVTKYSECGMGWDMPPGCVTVEEELMYEKGEIEDYFYQLWAENGYSAEGEPIDDLSEEHIMINAEDYFDKEKLEMIEEVLDDASSLCLEEITFQQIKRLMEK